MAYAETKRNNVKYYGVSLSTWVENISDSTARIHWSAAVDFGDWYYYGVRLHVKVGGVWRASGDGYTTSRGQRAVTVSGYTDAARRNDDYGVWVEAYTESVSVGGYGGVGSVTSCGESAGIPKIPAYKPDAPTDLRVTRSTDDVTEFEWVNHPDDGARKYYDGSNVYRHTNGGPTENLYNRGTISNWRDATTAANNYYDYDVRARWRGGTSDMSNSVRVYKTPAPPASVSLERTGDGEVSLIVRGPDIPSWITGFEVRATADAGRTYASRSLDADKVEPGVWSMADPAALAGDRVVYEVRTYKENPVDGGGETVASAWCASNPVATICAPYAPAVGGVEPAYPTGSTADISWTRNHPDGTAQSAAQVEVTRPGGAVETVDVSGATSSISLAVTAKGPWLVRVRTKGQDPSWGPWSEYAAFNVADPPQAFISFPADDGETVVELPLRATWTVADETGVSYQRLRLLRSGSSIVDVSPQTDERAHEIASGVENGAEYVLELTVRGGSGLSVTATRSFSTDWLPPAAPIVNVSYDDALAAVITVRDGISEFAVSGHRLTGPMAVTAEGNIRVTGGLTVRGTHAIVHNLPPCASFDIERVLADGSRLVLARGLKSGQSVVDRLPPLNVEFSYMARGHAASGTSSTTEVSTVCRCDGFALNFGPDASEAVVGDRNMGGPPQYSVSVERERDQFHFVGGGLPMGFESGNSTIKESMEFTIDEGDYLRVRGLLDRYGSAWVRPHLGDRGFAAVTATLSRCAPEDYRVSATTRRERWREPNGVG